MFILARVYRDDKCLKLQDYKISKMNKKTQVA